MGVPRTVVLGSFQPSLTGLDQVCRLETGLRPGVVSAVPSGLLVLHGSSQDCRPGLNSAVPDGTGSSLQIGDRIAPWGGFSRPFGTTRTAWEFPGLSSWAHFSRPRRDWIKFADWTQDCALGWFQPSLRDYSYCMGVPRTVVLG